MLNFIEFLNRKRAKSATANFIIHLNRMKSGVLRREEDTPSEDTVFGWLKTIATYGFSSQETGDKILRDCVDGDNHSYLMHLVNGAQTENNKGTVVFGTYKKNEGGLIADYEKIPFKVKDDVVIRAAKNSSLVTVQTISRMLPNGCYSFLKMDSVDSPSAFSAAVKRSNPEVAEYILKGALTSAMGKALKAEMDIVAATDRDKFSEAMFTRRNEFLDSLLQDKSGKTVEFVFGKLQTPTKEYGGIKIGELDAGHILSETVHLIIKPHFNPNEECQPLLKSVLAVNPSQISKDIALQNLLHVRHGVINAKCIEALVENNAKAATVHIEGLLEELAIEFDEIKNNPDLVKLVHLFRPDIEDPLFYLENMNTQSLREHRNRLERFRQTDSSHTHNL